MYFKIISLTFVKIIDTKYVMALWESWNYKKLSLPIEYYYLYIAGI